MRATHRAEDDAGYNLFNIDGEAGAWRCELVSRQRNAHGIIRDVARRILS